MLTLPAVDANQHILNLFISGVFINDKLFFCRGSILHSLASATYLGNNMLGIELSNYRCLHSLFFWILSSLSVFSLSFSSTSLSLSLLSRLNKTMGTRESGSLKTSQTQFQESKERSTH